MPRQWRSALNGFDAYWAPSVFIRDMLVSQTRRPVALIPQPVFLPAAPAAPQKFSGPLRCFSFFDFDSFSSRKNPFGAIRAFLTAFPNGHEEARLIIKCRGGQKQSRQELYSLAQKDPRIEILDRLIRREEMNALMEDCHVFLSLHRSEGFGLGCAEALARGKIVVATDYGGTRDFVSDATGYPVAYTLKELGLKDYPGARGAHWAEPNVEHAASILKDIYFNPERAQEKPLRGFEYLRDNHSFKVVGEKMRQAILSS